MNYKAKPQNRNQYIYIYIYIYISARFEYTNEKITLSVSINSLKNYRLIHVQ